MSVSGFACVAPFRKVLSCGQRYRANLAMQMARRERARRAGHTMPLCLDEFSSELDRPVLRPLRELGTDRHGREHHLSR